MKLYVTGKSKKNIQYTVDWISFISGDDKNYEITLNVLGEQYNLNTSETNGQKNDQKGINIKINGYFNPWVISSIEDGSEKDISDRKFTNEEISEMIQKGDSFEVGFYPIYPIEEKDLENAKRDIFSDIKCRMEIEIEKADKTGKNICKKIDFDADGYYNIW